MIERDGRTTVMIKNIPNKYSLKLLSDEIDEKHANHYDFLYLPFDFDVRMRLSLEQLQRWLCLHQLPPPKLPQTLLRKL